jgi:PAS domain S-box-containing protein
MSSQRARRAAPPGDLAAVRLAALSHDLMGALDARGRLVWTNAAWETVLGWSEHELAGTVYSSLVHPDERARVEAAEREWAAGETRWPELEVRVRAHGGAHRWFIFTAVYAPEEGLTYISGRDVSSRNELREARSVAHARYRALIANLPDTVVILYDHALRILVAEGGQLARRGLDASEYGGRLFSDSLPPEHFTRMEPVLRGALAGLSGAIEITTPDNEVVYRMQAVPVRDADGTVIGGLAVSRDVTERREAERALVTRAEELERSNAELAQFAYVASHDLSEPLRMVSSYLQLLRRRYHGQLDEDADTFIDYAVDGAARMRTLIEDLLAYSRAGRSEREPEAVDTGALVAEVVETLRSQRPEAKIACDGLPVVDGDPAQLTQLFQNLIGNGVKFVPAGTAPQVRVSAVREGGDWRFAVEDNGIGIEPRHADRVFGMFQRLHTRDDYPGTGIGLAIAKKVVEHHGGRIWVARGEPRGTRFEFTLPAQTPA